MRTLYEKIIDLCKSHGVAGGKMCTDIGISKSTLTDLKSGRKKTINLTTAEKIADYFGVTVDYLLGNAENEKTPADPQINGRMAEFMALFDSLTPDNQEALLVVMRGMKRG